MAQLRTIKWEEEQQGDKQRNPHPYLGLGIGFLLVAVTITATAGVLAAGLAVVIPACALFGVGIPELRRQRDVVPKSADREGELLSAIRENGGSITPTEAAMETPLTVRKADEMLSELAGGGHLVVERARTGRSTTAANAQGQRQTVVSIRVQRQAVVRV